MPRNVHAAAAATALTYEDALAVSKSPDKWTCGHRDCGSSSDVWISLTHGCVRCAEADHASAFMAEHPDAALFLEIAHPQRLMNMRTGREPRLLPSSSSDAKLLAVVAAMRNQLRELQKLGGDSLARSRGWAKIRAAVKLFGVPFLARSAQLQRRKLDAHETACLRWTNLELWRAFRTWKVHARALPAQPPPTVVIPEGRKREREEEKPSAGVPAAPAPAIPAAWEVPARIAEMDGRAGLRNMGNTCYMNSTIQALTHVPLFRTVLFASAPPTRRTISDMITSATLGIELPPQPDLSRAGAMAPPPPPPMMPRLQRSNSALADVMDPGSFGTVLGGSAAEEEAAPAGRPTRGSSRLQAKTANAAIVAPLHEVASRIFGAGERLAVYTPEAFLKAMWIRLPQFSGFNQQDVEEFMRALVNTLHEELGGRDGPPPVPSPISKLVGGATSTSVTCSVCGTVSRREESFLGPLSLEIPAAFRSTSIRRGKNGGACSLATCFASTFKDELMEGDNAYMCDVCGKKVKATLSRRLARTPPVLIVHVVRNDWASTTSAKIQTHVEFPLDKLDVSPWVEAAPPSASPTSASSGKETPATGLARKRRTAGAAAVESPATHPEAAIAEHTTYKLQSIVQHHGSGVRQGHYISVARDSNGFWHLFNDAKVTPMQETDVAESQAYILVFQTTAVVTPSD